MRIRRLSPLFTGAVAAMFAVHAAGTTIEVTSSSGASNDGSGCTLRDAIEAVNLRTAVGQCPAASGPIDTIDIQAGSILFNQQDPHSADAVLPAVAAGRSLNLFGVPQVRTTLFVSSSCDHFVTYGWRVLEVQLGAAIFVADVDFAGGCPDPSDALGGAGGAVANFGTMYLTRSTLQANSTVTGDLIGESLYPGAAVYNGPDAQFTATYVTFDSNAGGGALYVDVDSDTGFADVEDSTFSNNAGSSIDNHGAALVTNTTFFGNDGFLSFLGPSLGGAIFNADGGLLELSFASLLDNTQNPIGGTELELGANSTAYVRSTLFGTPASQVTANCDVGAGATVAWYGTSISNDPTCAGGGNLVNTDPLVDGAPADNGGPTRTLKLLAGSPAFGVDSDCVDANGDPVTTDQRGYPRPPTHCDAGAYEGDLIFANGFN